METSEVTLPLFKVFDAAKAHAGWLTAKDIADRAEVAGRTARAHASKLVALGIFDVAEVSPGHRYRFSGLARKRNRAMLQRLEAARAVFGLTAPRTDPDVPN
jgi:predicted ArsR family transcriptional regulator